MASHFYLLNVADISKETEEAVSVTFEIPDDLKDIFKFKHGQYLTVKVPINGKESRRAYSISSSPLDGTIRIGVKKVKSGTVSVYINEKLKVGDKIEVMPPMGNFTCEIDVNSQKEYVFFGAGSGITPLLSIIKTILKSEPSSYVNLLLSNKTFDTIMYRNELEELANEYSERFNLTHILSRDLNHNGLKGRITAEIAQQFVNSHLKADDKSAEYFLCGPKPMMDEVIERLKQIGIDKKNIHREVFTSKIIESEEIAPEVEEAVLKTRDITVILYGEEHRVTVEPDETILTAAMIKGIDPPFSCQIGACSTCRAKLKSGKVDMESRDALMDSEIEEGFILTCTSHPMSDDVVVDFDDNF